jgi:Spy/CpxP family protein refolding chaperone
LNCHLESQWFLLEVVTMSKTPFYFLATLLLGALPGLAQSAQPNNSPSGQESPMRRPGNQEPCWEVAGIQKSAIEQLRATERETHSQIEAVCTNTSLTPKEKHEQIHELREQRREKVEGLITPEQRKALESCRQERGVEHQNGMHDECGEWHSDPNGGSPNSPSTGNRGSNNSQSNSSAPQN